MQISLPKAAIFNLKWKLIKNERMDGLPQGMNRKCHHNSFGPIVHHNSLITIGAPIFELILTLLIMFDTTIIQFIWMNERIGWLAAFCGPTTCGRNDLAPLAVKLLWHCLWHFIGHKISYKMISKDSANVDYSPRYGQKTLV